MDAKKPIVIALVAVVALSIIVRVMPEEEKKPAVSLHTALTNENKETQLKVVVEGPYQDYRIHLWRKEAGYSKARNRVSDNHQLFWERIIPRENIQNGYGVIFLDLSERLEENLTYFLGIKKSKMHYAIHAYHPLKRCPIG